MIRLFLCKCVAIAFTGFSILYNLTNMHIDFTRCRIFIDVQLNTWKLIVESLLRGILKCEEQKGKTSKTREISEVRDQKYRKKCVSRLPGCSTRTSFSIFF